MYKPDSEIRFSLPFIMWPNEMTNSFLIKKKNANPASHIHIVKCSASIQYWPREFLPDSFVLLASRILHHKNNYFGNSRSLWSMLAPMAESGHHPAS